MNTVLFYATVRTSTCNTFLVAYELTKVTNAERQDEKAALRARPMHVHVAGGLSLLDLRPCSEREDERRGRDANFLFGNRAKKIYVFVIIFRISCNEM
jgi:hypothetical protein